jgi:ketosteroid isomerase-like protein
MSRTPREVAELIRRRVSGEDIPYSTLFAEDGVMRYPFAPPGMPRELAGRAALTAYHDTNNHRGLLDMDGVDLIVRETDDPEVVVAEIEHHGTVVATGEPYRFRSLGIIRVRDGWIVSYDDYMNPIAMAELLGMTSALAAALAS